MRQLSVSRSSVGTSDWMPIDRRGSAGDDYLLVVEVPGETSLVDLEMSPQRPENTGADSRDAPSIVITHHILKDLRESCASVMIAPFQSFRINVREYGGGEIKATVVQGGDHGN